MSLYHWLGGRRVIHWLVKEPNVASGRPAYGFLTTCCMC